MIAITHADLPAELYFYEKSGKTNQLMELYYPQFQKVGISILVAAVFVAPELAEQGLDIALGQVDTLQRAICNSGGAFVQVTTKEELETSQKEGKIAVILALEGVDYLGETGEHLEKFYNLGARMIAMTWNGANQFAGGCQQPEIGLTDAGKSLLERIAQNGMMLDVSHLGEPAFWQTMECYHGPVLASHSNSRCLCDHVRNLTDKQALELREKCGIIAINQVDFFTKLADNVVPADLWTHLEHFKNLVGLDMLGLGLDMGQYLADSMNPHCPYDYDGDVLKDYTEILAIFPTNLSDAAKENISYQNIYNFFVNNLPSPSF